MEEGDRKYAIRHIVDVIGEIEALRVHIKEMTPEEVENILSTAVGKLHQVCIGII